LRLIADNRTKRLWIVPLVLLALTACAHAPAEKSCPETGTSRPPACRTDAEPYPRLLVAGAEAGAPVFGRIASVIRWRNGYLHDQADAKAYVRSRLQPLDLVIVSSKGKATHRLLPGTFIHVAIYLGTEKELRALGLWNEETVRAHADAIEAGDTFIEAVSQGVRLASADEVLNADQAVVLRPSVRTLKKKRVLIRHFFEEIGTGFDFRFDAGDDKRLFCAELANHVLANQDIPLREVYGRTAIVPDDIIAAVLEGKSRLRFVAYVAGGKDGWIAGRKADLKRAHVPAPATGNRGRCS